MTISKKVFYASVVTLSGVALTRPAAAQMDINPPLPNVLLLVDSSGSMEKMPDGKLPAVCTPGKASDLNRWGTLVSVLTGTVKNRSCYAMNRSSSAFVNEYSIKGYAPYDKGYHLPHHRIVSNNCVAGPGVLPSNAFSWPSNAIKYHIYNKPGNACSGNNVFAQSSDGLLDVYRDRVRFGLMTFDPSVDKGTGLSGTTNDIPSGFKGMWSYYLDWQGSGVAASGYPPGCNVKLYEVGARNSAAPPWEGRMIAMGRSDAPLAEIHDTNDHIQEALLAMRPYGATPLAGMLDDAYTFFHKDKSADPLDKANAFAPAGDKLFGGGCRESYVILLSDGEPNKDLRPSCEKVGGKCPFDKPYEVAKALASPSDPKLKVKVFAIGFGLTDVKDAKNNKVDCTQLKMPTDLNPGGTCVNATGDLKACCTLARIAYEGGTDQAYFANDMATLKTTLSNVLSGIAAGSTSRTMPVFTSAGVSQLNGTGPVAYQFTTSFNPGSGTLWSGNLERHRWVCESKKGGMVAKLEEVNEKKGDHFHTNINKGKLLDPRRFITVIGKQKSNKGKPVIDSEGTIRPNLKSDDGMGVDKGKVKDGSLTMIANQMKSKAAAMDMYPMPQMCKEANLAASSEGDCAYKLMRWELGGKNGSLPTRSGDEFGAIYHSSPVLKGTPAAHIRDPAYEQFALEQAKRPLMLYSVTTDGQLHAFQVAPNDPKDPLKVDNMENNELWSFLPPHVLPNIKGQYPDTQQILLDGGLAIADVVYERNKSQAQAAGTKKGAKYATVIVGSGRTAGGFYYALDVTNPKKPEFLWQISHNQSGEPLFGPISSMPAITTIALKEGGAVKEVSVAILPGGSSTAVKGNCKSNRKSTNFSHINGAKPRKQVQCWKKGPGRSLTIVRLSDGSIIRTFRRDKQDGPKSISSSLVTYAPIDSPLTGTPVPYPVGAGRLANRIYIGDADGGMWRFDMSNPEPSKWAVHLAFDAYSMKGDTYKSGQPVDNDPAFAVDGQGNTVLLFSTGDQEMFTASSGLETRIWSITELPVATSKTVPFTIEANWVKPFKDGKRVTGPIAIFDKVAYFATFTPTPPNSNTACSDGYGSIWGVHYTDSSSLTEPLKRMVKDPNAKIPSYTDELQQAAGTVVFGVSVQAEPACYSTTTVTDDYVGSHSQISASSPPNFTLVYHTGQVGKSANKGSKTKATTRALPQPKQAIKIDSWASIVE